MDDGFKLSKSRLLAYRQCERRLWLEIHRRDLIEVSAQQQARFDAGHQVGELARQLADPLGQGILFDAQRDGFAAVLRDSTHALSERRPLFEAGFAAHGAIVFVDLLLPDQGTKGDARGWRLVEVKSSGSVKPYHLDDLAVQVHVLHSAGVELTSASVACLDTRWTYPGGGDYAGLLRYEEGLEAATARGQEVQGWIDGGQAVAARPDEPEVSVGEHCTTPFTCPFTAHCGQGQTQAQHPVNWLPRVQRKVLKEFLRSNGVADMAEVPDELLNATQRRVKHATLSGQAWFDAEGARKALAPHAGTLRFLDFEAAARPVPVWAGSRPYQQVPFQFSLHTLHEDGQVGHDEFIDLSGDDPSKAFAQCLVQVCGTAGPVFVYNAGFEGQVISNLAAQFPHLEDSLRALRHRLVDLRPVTEQHYYHPAQKGKWGLKSVLPTLGGGADHSQLEGVADGQMAVDAYLEATEPETTTARKEELRQQLLTYCRLDTWAMVRLWAFLMGRPVAGEGGVALAPPVSTS
jgi:predicted RecB family nuclease